MSSIDKLTTAQQAPPPTTAGFRSERRLQATGSPGSEKMESSPSPESAAPTPKEKAEIRASAGADESETREKNGSFVQPDGIEAAIEAFNSRISIANRSTRFKVSEETGDIQIQIVDVRTDEVIRSIPSDESLKIAARFRELAGNAVGALVDTSS